MDSRGRTQVVRLSSKPFNLLNHLMDPKSWCDLWGIQSWTPGLNIKVPISRDVISKVRRIYTLPSIIRNPKTFFLMNPVAQNVGKKWGWGGWGLSGAMECLSGFEVGKRLHGWSACCAILGTQVQYNTACTYINMLTFCFICKKEMVSSQHKKNGSK